MKTPLKALGKKPTSSPQNQKSLDKILPCQELIKMGKFGGRGKIPEVADFQWKNADVSGPERPHLNGVNLIQMIVNKLTISKIGFCSKTVKICRLGCRLGTHYQIQAFPRFYWIFSFAGMGDGCACVWVDGIYEAPLFFYV